MAYSFPEGSRFYFSTTFASAITVTALTNANPAVATATAHGLSNADELLTASGWDDATDTVWRASGIAANTFELSGLDSTNTSFYPTGTGTGTVRKVTNWVEMLQVLNIATSGGDARYTQIEPLSRRNSISVPTGFNPSSLTFTLGWDPTLAFYQTLVGVSRTLTKVAVKIVISGGGTAYAYGQIAVSEQPSMNRNQANTVTAALTALGRLITY